MDRLQLGVRSRPWVDCVVLAGEPDFCALAELAPTLDGLEVHADVLVPLDLKHLHFADVATIRVLGCFARRLRRTGHVMVTSEASSTLRGVPVLAVADDVGLP